MKDDLTRLLRRLVKTNNDPQYRKNVRTTTVYLYSLQIYAYL